MKVFEVLWTFTKAGLYGFGGGPSMMPVIQTEVVEIRKWLSEEEFLDAYALGSTLPGPIATKLSGYVGYKIAGWPGAMAGMLGVALPTVIAMVLLATLYVRYKNTPFVSSFMKGVRPVILAMLIGVVWEFWPTALGSGSSLSNQLQWRSWLLWLLASVALVLSIRYNVHPVFLILGGGFIGLLMLR
ncbi:MAG: chromate transporter [Trueperaceae bacterium]